MGQEVVGEEEETAREKAVRWGERDLKETEVGGRRETH